LAYRYPATTSGLVLLGAPARDPSRLLPFQPVSKFLWDSMISLNETMPFLVRSIYDRLIPAVRKNPWQMVFREMIRSKGFNNKLAKTSDIEEYIEAIFKVHPNVFYQMASTLSGYDIKKYEGKILTPSLVVAGAKDQVIPPSEAEYIHSQLRNSTLKMIPHGSHCPHFDDPVLVSGIIRQFLAQQKL